MARVLSSVPRALSVSSTRSRNWPPYFLTNSQLKSAVRAPPTCRKPVGDGANLSRFGITESYQLSLSRWAEPREADLGYGGQKRLATRMDGEPFCMNPDVTGRE